MSANGLTNVAGFNIQAFDETLAWVSKHKYGVAVLATMAASNVMYHFIDKSWQELSAAADKGHLVEVDFKLAAFRIQPIPAT